MQPPFAHYADTSRSLSDTAARNPYLFLSSNSNIALPLPENFASAVKRLKKATWIGTGAQGFRINEDDQHIDLADLSVG